MPIEQFKVGYDNFTYVIYCRSKQKAAIVDPGYDITASLNFIIKYQLQLQYIILTHYHQDHVGQTLQLKTKIPMAQIVASKNVASQMNMPIDIFVSDNDRLTLGTIPLIILHTPGHTPGSICIIINDEALITGDTLFIGDCGRTDLPDGNLTQMYHTLQNKIKNLPDHLIVYPGHDYGEKTFDTLGNQKKTNKTLRAKTLEEFSQIP